MSDDNVALLASKLAQIEQSQRQECRARAFFTMVLLFNTAMLFVVLGVISFLYLQSNTLNVRMDNIALNAQLIRSQQSKNDTNE